jgi:hypothetical protein
MNSNFRTAQSLAHAISEIASVKLTPRPYNQFAPDETIWWLVPSVEWPAYKFGKLFFEPRMERIPGRSPGSTYFGFYVERGLGPVVGQIYPPTWVMHTDWFWTEFLNRLQFGLPDCPTERVITISAGPLRPPERGRQHDHVPLQEEDFKASRLFFVTRGGTDIELFDKELNPVHTDITEYLTTSLAAANTTAQLASALRNLPSSFDWAWIDLYVGTVLGNSDRITAAELWAQYLRPWEQWLRCGE